VSDGLSVGSTSAIIHVDTVKKTIINEKDFITTVNKEFIHKIKHKKNSIYKKQKGPHNLRISKKGVIHWIPIKTQIGYNDIVIEVIEKQQTTNYGLKIFVNAPPVISYTPDTIEYINYKENFSFQMQSFDENINQKLYWDLIEAPKNMILNESATLLFEGLTLDYNNYSIQLTDTINTDIFKGYIYVNSAPTIEPILNQHITLGETFSYNLNVKDLNLYNPQTQLKEEHLLLTK
jgi:hypothetical protein